MIQAQSRLIGQLRSFVEGRLCGVGEWNDVRVADSAPSDRPKRIERGGDWRERQTGRWKELAVISFGQYEIEIRSPDEHPPLGWLDLRVEGITVSSGPLDHAIWENFAAYIIENGMRKDHGQRIADESGWQPAR